MKSSMSRLDVEARKPGPARARRKYFLSFHFFFVLFLDFGAQQMIMDSDDSVDALRLCLFQRPQQSTRRREITGLRIRVQLARP